MILRKASPIHQFTTLVQLCVGLTITFGVCIGCATIAGCKRTANPAYSLQCAIEANDIPTIKTYLARGGAPEIAIEYIPKSWATPLHIAAQEGRSAAVVLFLDAGADPNAACSQGKTPLHWIAETRGRPSHLECAKTLLERGADPAARSRDGSPILHWACDTDSLGLAMLLIEWGAEVNTVVPGGDTPLHEIAELPRAGVSGIKVARALVDHGAHVQAKNSSGRTALDVAREAGYGEMVEFLTTIETECPRPPSPNSRPDLPGSARDE